MHDQVEDKLSFAFEDRGDHSVKNIARPVHVYRIVTAIASPAGLPAAEAVPPPSISDRPSLAVLPFTNMSGDPEQEYFVDGIVEDIITGLSRIKWLFVTARNSTFVYKGRAVDVSWLGANSACAMCLKAASGRAAIGCGLPRS